MTFEQWRHDGSWKDLTPVDLATNPVAVAQAAWNAATRAEREQCVSRVPFAVDAIIADLSDRQGLKHEWRQIDSDIRDEISQSWERAIVAAIVQD